MSLIQTIKSDLELSRKGGDPKLLSALKLMVSELLYKEIELKAELSDDVVVAVLQKEARKRQESIDIYEKAGDSARADQEKYELALIKKYLPELMSDEEILKEVAKASEETGKRGGVLIGEVKKRLGSKADGAAVSRLVLANYG